MKTYFTQIQSPIGELLLTSDGRALTRIYMQQQKHADASQPDWQRDDSLFADVRDQFDGYFAGQRQNFELPMAPAGTEFQRSVWRALCEIPYGQTVSYGELAQRLGKPKASRAVGMANGRNPISIIVPCHRVIGADGSLTGYGGGIERKRWLLAHEGCPVAGQATDKRASQQDFFKS